ncbi:MAG: TorF family putative porin [bacterium]
MKAIKKALAVATVVSATAAPIAAQAAEVSGNVTMATDYRFRGISQTDERFAIQGGFDVGFDSGFYIGTWASNVNFSDSSGDINSAELDFYAGYGFEVSEGVALDFSVITFVYPAAESEFNYEEYVAGLSVGDLGLSVVYSNNYFGSDADAFVYNIDYAIAVSEDVAVDLHVGYSDVDEDYFFGEDDSYLDWSIAVTKSALGLDFSLAYIDTDLDEYGDDAEGTAVFSVSKSL